MDVTDIYHDGRQYDLMFGSCAAGPDLDFYLGQAARGGGEVLELGCGTGRLAIPMAQRGLTVTGLDLSASMLAVAREKSAVQGVPITWVQTDCREFVLGKMFGLVCFPANSFLSLLDRADQEMCLACVRRHLAPEGRFVFEIFNPSLRLLTRDPLERFPITQYRDPETGQVIMVTESVAYDAATQVNYATWYYQREGEDECREAKLALRVLFPQELDPLLHYNGFAVEAKYGDFHETPFDSSARRQIVVCQARS